MTAIVLDQLCKVYRQGWRATPLVALKELSLSVEAGEVFGFIGPNGAGKSTAIKILTGVSRPSSGTAKLFGVDVGLPEARRGLGYVPENPSLPDYLNPLEILSMGLALHGARIPNARAHCLNWLDRFGLSAASTKVVRGFSKGMAQRTALAHAMAVRPRLLILDEPLSGLDPIGRRDVVEILSEYKREGGTIFLTSHVLHDVERLADRFGLIHRGQMRTVQTPGELVGASQTFTVRTIGPVAIEGMRSESGDRWTAEVVSADLWQFLEAAQKAAHTIIEVRPALSLESAFMRIVEE